MANQTSLDIRGLTPSEAYGIKVLVLFDEENADDIPVETWSKTPTHVFVVPPSPVDPEQTVSNGSTSAKPRAGVRPASEGSTVAAAITVPFVVVVSALLAVFLWWRWRNGQKLAHLHKLQEHEFRPYTHFMPGDGSDRSSGEQQRTVADDWELPHSCMQVGRVLGAGAFGQVLLGRVSRAHLHHRELPPKYSSLDEEGGGTDGDPLTALVAIKMLKEGCDEADKAEFLREIKLMKELGSHSHVVSMLGCCTLQEPYCLLVEHMAKGDLLNYLKNIRRSIADSKAKSGHYQNHEAEHIRPLDLLSFARQIALGMDFLADKGYVHRDLAARNVLVGEGNEVKVGDFGLARYVYTDQVYVNRKGGKLPLKWMALESIFDLTFSTASDIWAFGVVLFEIVTLGGTPYPTIHIRDLLKALKGGYRMERPDNCSEEMYRMMRACWQQDPEERPSFRTLLQWLEEMMLDVSGVQYLDMDLNPSKDYYTCSDSHTQTDSSEVAEALSPLFSRDSGSETESSEDVDDAVFESSSELKLTSSDAESDSVMTKMGSGVNVHREPNPGVSVSGSSSSSSSSSSSVLEKPSPCSTARSAQSSSTKSVRFFRGRQAGGTCGAAVRAKDSEGSSASENEVWNSESEACSPLSASSHDAAWDDVFITDVRDTGWVGSGPALAQVHDHAQAQAQAQQPRVFPRERHPCGLFRVSLLSDMTSVSDDLVLARNRARPLDSQGESVCTSSSSSGESVTLFPPPLEESKSKGSPRLLPTSRQAPSGPERCCIPSEHSQPKLGPSGNRDQNRHPSRYQQRLTQQRCRVQPSQNGHRHAATVTRSAHNAAVLRGPNAELKKPSSSIFKSLRGPIVFTKGASTPCADDSEVTAL